MPGPGPSREVINRRLLADHVYDRLMVELVDGRLEAGARVGIDALAREFGVSPTPVREALARIEWTGLVTRVALKGYRVAPPFTVEDLRQLFEARRVIEPATASAAAVHTTSELCTGLEHDLEDLRTAPRGPSFADFRRYWEADERFHRRIAEHSGNRYLLRAYSALGGQVQRYRFFVGRGVTDAQPTVHEHREILAAVRTGTRAPRVRRWTGTSRGSGSEPWRTTRRSTDRPTGARVVRAATPGTRPVLRLAARAVLPATSMTSVVAVPLLGPTDPLPHRPRRIVVAGTSGSGKTTLARRVGPVLDVPHVEIDALFHGPGWDAAADLPGRRAPLRGRTRVGDGVAVPGRARAPGRPGRPARVARPAAAS